MKNIITTIFIALLTYSMYAQVPGIGQVPFGMKYQAVARGADGQAMNGETVALRFTILQGSADGTVVFTEQQSESTNDVGLFDLVIGEVNNTDFINIDWRLGDHFLKVELNDGGWVDLGTHQLLSVPYAMTAGNGKMQNPTAQDESLRFYGTNDSENVVIGGNGADGILNDGLIQIKDENGDPKVTILSNPNQDAGSFVLRGRNNNNNVAMGAIDATNVNFGFLRIHDDNGQQRVTMWSAPGRGGLGTIDLRGENNNLNLSLTNAVDNNHGAIIIHDSAQQQRLVISSNPNRNGAGVMSTYGANLNPNVSITTSANNNHGSVAVHSGNGVAKAGMYVDNVGMGIVWGDEKCFRMNHPKDAEKEIWYASIEGPEAAAYERGTAQLVNGEAQVDFSEHFELVANPETMTVILTPNSALSEGLAVIKKTATGIKIKELRNGTGNYKFDWEVKCVRKGFEDFEVIRDKKEMERMMGINHSEENK